MKNPSQPPFKKKQSNAYIRYSSIGFQMVAIVAIGVLIGTQLDKRFTPGGTAWFTLGFSFLFVILSMIWAIWNITKEQ